jgi:hypothetical protein
MALAVNVNIGVIKRQSSGYKDPKSAVYVFLELAVVNRRREAVQVGHKQVHLKLTTPASRHVDRW